MKNLVKKLEAEGRIPKGKYIAVFEEEEVGISLLKSKDGNYGMIKSDTDNMIPAIFYIIRRDAKGNYICSGFKQGKSFCNIYDSELKLVRSNV